MGWVYTGIAGYAGAFALAALGQLLPFAVLLVLSTAAILRA